MANYEAEFRSHHQLISKLGEGNAYLVWTLGLYIDESDLDALASEALTDGKNDKKLDFLYLDRDGRRIVFAQGYYAQGFKDSAPANKASDLNTAAAWLFSGDTSEVPATLRAPIEECRQALTDGEVDSIELLFVHNLPESVNVTKELRTAAQHIQAFLSDTPAVSVQGRELGTSRVEQLYATRDSHIDVKQEIACPAQVKFSEEGPKWRAHILSVPGQWLHDLFVEHGEALFSANYRGFLGINKRRRINSGIRSSAEGQPKDFWVFNNGVTLLTLGITPKDAQTMLSGVSIINGAQTTGSLGSVDTKRHDLKDVKVLCRVIESADDATINEIVRFNNTQNEITNWDQYSNDPDQLRIKGEFEMLGHAYSQKRGFSGSNDAISIEEVAQPLVAFHGRFEDANGGKNRIFERKPLYNSAFPNRKARHILFVLTLARAIDERRGELKRKSSAGTIITLEEQQLALLRHLRFKYFLVAEVARLLEVVLGRKVDLDAVAFSPEAASFSKNSLVDLVAAWSPIVEAVLTFATTVLPPTDVTRRLGQTDAVAVVAKQLEALLYTTKASAPFEAFRGMVSDS